MNIPNFYFDMSLVMFGYIGILISTISLIICVFLLKACSVSFKNKNIIIIVTNYSLILLIISFFWLFNGYASRKTNEPKKEIEPKHSSTALEQKYKVSYNLYNPTAPVIFEDIKTKEQFIRANCGALVKIIGDESMCIDHHIIYMVQLPNKEYYFMSEKGNLFRFADQVNIADPLSKRNDNWSSWGN